MSWNKSDLHSMRGTILLRLGRYSEALEAYEDAIRGRVHHSYYYNKATVLLRLGRTEEAEYALQQAIDFLSVSTDSTAKKQARQYQRHLTRLRSHNKPLLWWDWWFGQGNWVQRLCGAILCLLLLSITLFPVTMHISVLLLGRPLVDNWIALSTNSQIWLWYLIPIGLILFLLFTPMLRRGKSTKLKAELLEPQIEPVDRRLTSTSEVILTLEPEKEATEALIEETHT